MKQHYIEVECSVCGGPALARLQDAYLPVVHADPAACHIYNNRRARELDKREEALADG